MLHHKPYYLSYLKLISLYSRNKFKLHNFLTQVNAQYGEKVSYSIPGKNVHFLFCKEAVNTILVKREKDFCKTRYTLELDKLLGKGLLTSEGSVWHKNRKLIQPFFKKQIFQNITADLEHELELHFDRFESSFPQSGRTINLVEFIHSLILSLTAKTLFGLNINEHTREISSGLQLLVDSTRQGNLSKLLFGFITNRKIQEFRNRVEKIILKQDEAEQSKSTNFLSFLLRQSRDHPGCFDHQQIVDEALTMLFAGHETTANVLCWAFVELSHHLNWQESLISNAKSLKQQGLSFEKVREYPNFEKVFLESTRLYPPAWVLARETQKDQSLLGLNFKEKDLVVLPTWFIQRSKSYWEHPDTFNPERFEGKQGTFHDGSFFPFSMGARTCIGRQLATVQSQLILANFFKRFRIKLAQDRPTPVFQVLLRPPSTIMARVERI